MYRLIAGLSIFQDHKIECESQSTCVRRGRENRPLISERHANLKEIRKVDPNWAPAASPINKVANKRVNGKCGGKSIGFWHQRRPSTEGNVSGVTLYRVACDARHGVLYLKKKKGNDPEKEVL